jgi:hypothetical protein
VKCGGYHTYHITLFKAFCKKILHVSCIIVPPPIIWSWAISVDQLT